MRTLVRLMLTILALYTPRVALANGRFPKAQAIVTVPGDARAVYLLSTFGLVASNDGGATWRWVCEEAMGYAGTWDPPLAATRDGRVWIGLPDGLAVMRGPCDVRMVDELRGEVVADLTLEPDGARVAVLTSTPGKAARVWRANARGVFEPRGAGVEEITFDTLEIARSKPARVYATGTAIGAGGKRAHLFRSDDGGTTLAELTPALDHDGRLFVSAVDPKDPDRVFVRLTSEAGTDLLLSKDGGRSFARVLHTNASMFGFAASSDGEAYFAGSGDPAEGIFRSRDRGLTWEPASKRSVLCLHADGARLFACSNPYAKGGWAIAVSTDAASSFRPLATFDDVGPPAPCDAGPGAACASAWPDVRAQIEGPSRGDRASRDAGASGGGADASRAAGGAARRACGCGASGASGPSAGALALLVLLARVRRRRARRVDRT